MWEQQKTKDHRLRRKTNSMSPFNRSILSDPLVVTHPPKEKRNHALLWHQGVAHNNINFKHLLFTCPDKTGVLNDFDLLATSNKEALRHPDNSRTGSLPFMAVELLNEKGFNSKIPRRYDRELESFAWIPIWVSRCVLGCEKSERPSALKEWIINSNRLVHLSKVAFWSLCGLMLIALLTKDLNYNHSIACTPSQMLLQGHVRRLHAPGFFYWEKSIS